MKNQWVFLWMLMGMSSFATAQTSPTSEDLLKIVFQNLATPLPRDSCVTKSCTVGEYVRETLTSLAEEGFKEKSTSGQPAWSSSKCDLQKAGDRKKLIEFLARNTFYGPSALPALAEFSGQDVWECRVSWGVRSGEVVWSRDLKFFLNAKKELIPGTFATFATP